jgi:NitT/TauT family transport system substrate-binding protein
MAQAIIASDRTIAERPEMVSGFVTAVLRAIGDINADPAAAAAEYTQFVPQHSGKEAQIAAIMTSYSTLIYPEGENQPLGTFDPARITAVQDFYVESGIVRRPTPVEDLYTNAFIK